MPRVLTNSWGHRLARRLAVLVAVCLVALAATPASRAQGVDVAALALDRQDGQLTLEFSLRTQLPRGVEDALMRGVPMYFLAQATLYRHRWYWRDERVARVSRQWRLAYQPLTGSWRLGIGALTQNYSTLSEAMAMITRTSGWRLAELSQLDPDARHYVEFSFRLDTAQLPPPMQVGLTGGGGWQLGLERTLRVE
ncbi:MAG: DUF4390 domain-containing protein [Rubrivivax sp.]|nr:DUF4390 domain-containing protein [Rubrivivax sp.]